MSYDRSYGPPQGQPPYQQPPYGYPPPQQQMQPGYPPQGPPGQGWQQPPMQGGAAQAYYGAPPPNQFPPQQGYGAPQGQPSYSSGPSQLQAPDPPSPGYDLTRLPPVDTTHDAMALRLAMKGLGTDEKALITILVRIPDPLIMASLVSTYSRTHKGRSLLSDIHSETSHWFREGLEALVRGPLAQDVHQLHEALSGPGTREAVLNDVLLGRRNADVEAIKREYRRVHHRSLEADVRGDLSFKTERLFDMVLAAARAPESAPVYPEQLAADVREMYAATEGHRIGADQLTVCRILTSRSDGQIRAIAQEYRRQYHSDLAKVLDRNFDGHMHDALLRILKIAEDSAMADAEALEASMKGAGTKDRLLVNRLVRLHWQRDHFGQVKGAYKVLMKGTELVKRVEGETSGDYRRLMVAIILGHGPS